MNFLLKVRTGSKSHESVLELTEPARLAKAAPGRLRFTLDGKPAEADWAEISTGVYSILLGGQSFEVYVRRAASDSPGSSDPYALSVANQDYVIEVEDPRRQRFAGAALGPEGPQEVPAPMPGRIVKVLVSEGEEVEAGQGLLVIEAMKMQNELRAPRSGRVEKIHVREGTGVETGVKLLRLV